MEEEFDNGFDRKSTNITIRVSPFFKSDLIRKAKDVGLSLTDYCENSLIEAERSFMFEDKFKGSENVCAELRQEVKDIIAAQQAKENELEEAFAVAYEHAMKNGISTLKNAKPKSFQDFLLMVAKIVKI
jgi:hypothetical protein